MMNQTTANGHDELLTTDTSGLLEMESPGVIRLHDKDQLDLRIGPVRKTIDGAVLRMLAYNGSVPAFPHVRAHLWLSHPSENAIRASHDSRLICSGRFGADYAGCHATTASSTATRPRPGTRRTRHRDAQELAAVSQSPLLPHLATAIIAAVRVLPTVQPQPQRG
jgi:hypothetical protein